MRLDVVVPTHNRAALLSRTLDSLLAADTPPGLDVRVIVVDNRSTDGTRAAVESYQATFGDRLRYVYEVTQGRSPALNAGIRASSGDLIGMIDDDEEVDRTWYRCIATAFADGTVDFIGGPYVPRWGAPRPAWLGTSHRAAVGWVDGGSDIRPFGPGFDGILMGGNAVIRRTLVDRVGLYAVDLGRTATRLLSCEDEDMFKRLLAAGARGFYRPDLIIHHFVPPERLEKRYFRRWCFWHGVSRGMLDRRQPQAVTYLAGVPRYMIGAAARGALEIVRTVGTSGPARRFSNELSWWSLAGFLYGKYRYRHEESEQRTDELKTAEVRSPTT
jgi:glycosyltransferase involved in cell wall biosynthesis